MKILVSLISGGNNHERQVLRNFHTGIIQYYIRLFALGTDSKRPVERNIIKLGGPEIELSYDAEFKKHDVGVQFGVAKPREQEHHLVRQNLAKSAANRIFIETPVLGRKIVEKNKHDYYRIGYNGFLNDSGIFYPDSLKMNDSRLRAMEADLGFKFPGWKDHKEGNILILLQLVGDASLRGQNHAEWLVDTVGYIREKTDRNIVIRLHPSMSDKGKKEFFSDLHEMFVKNYKNIIWSDPRERDLNDDLKEAGIAVSYSSGSAVDAILAGVPCITMDRGNMAYPVSSHFIHEIEAPDLPSPEKIEQWLIELSYSQWTEEEMLSGQVWEHLLKIIEEETPKEESNAEEISSDIPPKHS